MRSVSVRACGAALLILLVTVTAVPVFGGEPIPGTEAPQGRIAPPVGAPAEAAPQTRIQPPGGAPAEAAPQGRIHIPVGVAADEEPPSVWELFLVWLQGRIHIPGG